MLGNLSFELGPFNIPVWLIAAVGGLALAIIVEKTVLRRHRTLFRYANDLLLTGVVWGFVAWKLTPILTRFNEILAEPLRLLYYPGGTAGVAVGAVAAALGIFLSVVRSRRRAGKERDEPAENDDGESATAPSIKQTAIAGALTLALVVLPVIATHLIPIASGTKLPAQPVELLEDSSISQAELAEIGDGGPVVLVFWATWCGPCTAQMPEIERFHQESGEQVAVLAVNLTPTEPSVDAVRAYVDSTGLTVRVVLDRSDLLRTALGVSATPTTIVFDAGGTERVRRTGAVTASWISRRVLPLMR